MIDSEELDSSQSQPNKPSKESYRKIKLLGEGAYGKAYLVESVQDGTKWVIKQINISDMSQEQCDQTTRQAKILEQLNHPNIVRFRQVYRTNKMKLSIVMEYADGGDLASKIAQRKKANKLFTEVEVLNWFTQICLAIKHVHDRKVIHRDIKGQNIFLTGDDIVKLGDFGIARVLHRTVQKAKTVVGTPYYLSPEIIENKPYSFKSDIWSLGVLLYEMCALTPPFTGNSLQFLALKIVKGSYTNIPPSFSRGLQNLIKSMLNVDPNRRPSIHQILESNLLINRITDFLSESKKQDEFSHTILHKHDIFKGPLVRVAGQEDEALRGPPSLLKRENFSVEMEKKEEKREGTHFGDAFIPPPAPKLMKGTPPIQHKAPINGFYRPPSSNLPRPIANPKPDLGDILNIKAPPLNPHVMKTPLPKIKTPQAFKKRPSTPNLGLQIVQQIPIIIDKISVEGDFKKKQPRYSAGQPIKRGASEDRVSNKNRKIDCAPKQDKPNNTPKIQVPKAPTVPTPKNMNIGMNAMVPPAEPSSHKPVRKDSYSKPQSAGTAPKRKTQQKVQKRESEPVVRKQVHKEGPKQVHKNPKPAQPKKEQPKKVVKKKEKPQKPLQIKSQEVKKLEAEEKKKKRQDERKKMKEFITLKRKQLSQTQRQTEVVEQQKTQELPSEPEVVKPHSQPKLPSLSHTKSHEQIEQQIQYQQQPFEQYQTTNQLEYSSVPDLTAPSTTPSAYEIQYPISIKKQRSKEQSPRKQMPSTPQGYVQIKHSVQFNKMLEQMQLLVVKATQAVNNIPQNPVPDLQELAMQLTLPSDRQDDSQSVCPSDLQYSKTQQNLALECLADRSKLQDLKITLEDVFGVENFIAAYRYIQRLIEQLGLDFDQAQTIKTIAAKFPLIKEDVLAKYFSLLVTVVVLENPFTD